MAEEYTIADFSFESSDNYAKDYILEKKNSLYNEDYDDP
jgi:hypothetical protein